jgi:hypothetical protein
VDPRSLIVPRRYESQLDGGATDRHRGRQEVALVALGEVSGNRIDLARPVSTMDEAFGPSSTGAAPHYDNVAAANRPLALNTKEAYSQVEDEVVFLVIQGSRHT